MADTQPFTATPQLGRVGRIITFYSFKGGTGRSMALANVACLLANKPSSGKVLVIDWDLEAPGLDKYFSGLFEPRKEWRGAAKTAVDAHPGLIDFFEAVDIRSSVQSLKDEELIELINPTGYLLDLNLRGLSIIKAGRSDGDYAKRVSTFDWYGFYNRRPNFFAALSSWLSRNFDYILIDSRTGITDTSGICTTLMPDKLVVVFTPNHQSLGGVLSQVRKATEYRLVSTDIRPLSVYPLPSRIELSEPRRKNDWRRGNGAGIEGYQPAFERLFREVYERGSCDLTRYFDEVQIQYVAPYAYGEEIASLRESETDRLSLARSFGRFCERLTGTEEAWSELPDTSVPADEFERTKLQSEKLALELTKSKKSSKRIVVGSVITSVAITGILAAIALPAYQDYTLRAKASEGILQASEARAAVAEYIAMNGRFPTIPSPDFDWKPTLVSKYVKSIAIRENGVVAVTYSDQLSDLSGKTILFRPSGEKDTLSWSCDPNDAPQQYLPNSCRK